MAEITRVWVRTTTLDTVVHGKIRSSNKRSLPGAGPSEGSDSIRNWGWSRAELVNGPSSGHEGELDADAKEIKVYINDRESPYDRNEVTLPGSVVKEGNLVMANVYGNNDDEDDEEEDDDYYSDEGEDTFGAAASSGSQYPDDLIILTHLHEPSVVFCLRKRYSYDKIYTATGPILLALNPFKNCKSLYNEAIMKKYWNRGERSMLMGGASSSSSRTSEEEKKSETGLEEEEFLPPHVYGIADNSFRIMMSKLEQSGGGSGRGRSKSKQTCNQSILVSGESGAGKTVTTKFIMQYLATLSKRSAGPIERTNSGSHLSAPEKPNIEQQVLQSNPILESFGNARTIRNDNSSRFGKFIEIQFTSTGSLIGANIETYLLEKVRLITQAEGERNYHIFYELLQGMPEEELDAYHLSNYTAEDFRITNSSGTYDRRDGVDDSETYLDLINAMETMGFSDEERINIFNLTSALLHLSNVECRSISEDESEIDGDNEHLEPALRLFGFEQEPLNRAICYFSIMAGKEKHFRSLSKQKAEKGIEGLIKATYGALFTLIVNRVNKSIGLKSSTGRNANKIQKGDASIGVLDIFGFESFRFNSFEQLCINYCNEALQQQFNLFVLKNEQEEYEREGIQWSFISFPENQDVLDLIDKKGSGILSILDDQCKAPGTTDKTFANDLYGKCSGHGRFEADFRQVGSRKFAVVHYAGTVEYSTDGFVEKNRDELPKESTELLMSSTNAFVKDLAVIISGGASPSDSKAGGRAPPARGRGASSGTRVTVGGQFSKQLKELREKIDLTSPHYVRCLKPNDELIPDTFDPIIVADQLRCAGVVEAVRVSRVGYPQRYSHSMFVSRYRILGLKAMKKASRSSRRQKPVMVLVNAIAEKIAAIDSDKDKNKAEETSTKKDGKSAPIDLVDVGMQVGKTKVFLRRKAYEILERLRNREMRNAAVKIQSAGRRYIAKSEYKSTLHAVLRMQCFARQLICRNKVQEVRCNHNATLIQKYYRKWVAFRSYQHTLLIAKFCQCLYRGSKDREKYKILNEIRKATKIQTFLRCNYHRRLHTRKKKACLSIQCAMRCVFAITEMKSLKANARNLQATAEERDKLKKENQKLKTQLEEAKLKLTNAELTMTKNSAVDSEEVIELRKKIEVLETDLALVQTEQEVGIQKLLEAESTNENLSAQVGTLNEKLDNMKQNIAEKEAAMDKQNEELRNAKNELERMNVSIQELEDDNIKMKENEKDLEDQLAKSKGEHDKILFELHDAQHTIDNYKNDLADDDHSDDASNRIEAEEFNRVCKENERLQQELDDARAKVTEISTVASTQMLGEEKIVSPNDKIFKENESLKTEISQLKEVIKAHNSEMSHQNVGQDKEDLMKVIDDLRKQNEELKKNVVTSNGEITSGVTENGTSAIGLSIIQESTVDDDSPVSESKLQEEIVSLKGKLEKLENNEQASEVLTLQDEVSRLNQEIVVLRESNHAEEVLTLQDEIQRLNKELADSKTSNGENDRNYAMTATKQFDQMGRLVDAVMEKDIEIRDLKREINSLNEKLETERSPNSSHAISYNEHDEDDDDSNIVSRLFNRNNRRPPQSNLDPEDSRYKSMYEELKAINETMRQELEALKKECNLMKFKLKEEQERSAKDLEAFAVALRGVDELRSAAEEMSRELKRRDEGQSNYSSAAQASFNASEILDKLERANTDMSLPKKHDQETDLWAGMIKTMRSIPSKERKSKRKDKGRRKRRGSGNSSVITSFF